MFTKNFYSKMVAGALFLIVVLYLITRPVLQGIQPKFKWFQVQLATRLFWYHMLFAGIYYITVMNSPSDSVQYFLQPQTAYESWFDAFDTGTPFMHFLGYPFINYLGFTYEMMMVLFAWLGYWGFVCFYIFFRENIRFKHKWHGYDLVTIFLFLPNMHYWTASLGKGAVIFLGLGLTVYGLSRLNQRKLTLVFGLALIYYIRPHIFMVLAASIIAGLLTGRQKVPLYQKLIVLAGGALALFLLYDKILAFAQVDSDNLVGSFGEMANKRAADLAKSGSGIDISSYPYPLKLLTFWFRPLFFDSPSIAGLMVSLENLFYIMLTFKLFQNGFIPFVSKSSAIVKTSIVVFLGTSLALCGTLSNLGLIIRQKTMIMYFFLFVVVSFLDEKKFRRLQLKKQAKAAEEENSAALVVTTS